MVNNSLTPIYSRMMPNMRYNKRVSMAAAIMAAGIAVHTPATPHHKTARHSITLLRMCPINAAGAQPRKYSRFTPPASYCDTPANAVRYNTNSEPPPTPNPLMMPVARPIMMPNKKFKRTPPLSRRTESTRQTGDGSKQRAFSETSVLTACRRRCRRWHRGALAATRCRRADKR